jgi:hypothetical protein
MDDTWPMPSWPQGPVVEGADDDPYDPPLFPPKERFRMEFEVREVRRGTILPDPDLP